MRHLALSSVLALLSVPLMTRADFVDAKREVVSFNSGRQTFAGYFYKPEGHGPFPAVVWVHGHADHLTKSSAAEYNELAKLYTREGFVLFIPDRHMHDISRSEYSAPLQKLLEQDPKAAATQHKQMAEDFEINARDVTAATEWLKEQTCVDTSKLIFSGWAHGGSLCVLAAEKRHDIRAMALFYTPAGQWGTKSPVQPMFLRAMRSFSGPVFAIRATDDPSPDAFKIVTTELKKKNGSKTQQYVHSGYDNKERNSLAVNDCDAWGYDVLQFLEKALKD